MVRSLLISLLLALLLKISFCSGQSNLTNVQTALFRNNIWDLNVNYISANSSSFWREYILKADCETVVKFQEVFCIGKSINVIISNLLDSKKVYNLKIDSKLPYNCTLNIQNANEAALNPLYSKGQVTLPTGLYSIKMKLDDYQNVLGFRGFALKASVSLDRLLLARKCRVIRNQNSP